MIVIGVDIGITGAMAAVDSRGTASVVDLPTVEDAAGKRIDGRELLNAIRAMSPAGESSLAIIEDVRPRPGPNTAHTMGSLMGTRRSIEAVLDVAGVKVIAVQPATWKRFFGLINAEKAQSLETARSLFPLQGPMLKRKKDHNRAEALLLAHYGQKVKA